MRISLISITIFILLPIIVKAEPILFFVFKFYADQKVELLSSSFHFGTPEKPFPGDYKLTIESKQGKVLYSTNFSVSFLLLSNQIVELKETVVYLKVPYKPEMNLVKIFYKDKKIFEAQLNICNYDGKCEEFENFYTCPKDCPSATKDNVCDALIDEKCDPDCPKEVDLDCNPQLKERAIELKKERVRKEKVALFLTASIGLLALGMIGFVSLKKIRKRK